MNVTARIEDHRANPFDAEERGPAQPGLWACPEAGVLYLAAYGIEGEAIVSLEWKLPEATTCEAYEGIAATGSHHRYHVSARDRPDGTTSIGGGTGGGGLIVSAFAGPLHSDELRPGQGATAWGGGFEDRQLASGVHRYTIANSAWGPWETGLTDGAAFLFMLACEGPVELRELLSTGTLHLFDEGDMAVGAGVDVFLAGGASGGRALDTEMPKGGTLQALGYAFAGVGALRVSDENGSIQRTFAPDRPAEVDRDLPAGVLSVDLVQTGSFVIAAGMAYGPLEPIDPAPVVGTPQADDGS